MTSIPPALRTTRPEPVGVKGEDPGASRRYRFRHPTASGQDDRRSRVRRGRAHRGVLILTHRRLLVDQFRRDLTREGTATG